jgi:bis(5'-nucleosyl)-tetraphosphatase (symmetrical)
MYGSKPERWSESLCGWDRLRVIVNAMTRMRFCGRDGRMEFHAKGKQAPAGYVPWFEARTKEQETIIFGHWSALGLKLIDGFAALDCGCVWGGSLAALRLDDRKLYQVPCSRHQAPGAEG